MTRRSSRWKKNIKGTEVNLIPVLNLIAILIPMMLIQQEYISIAGIHVETPLQGIPQASPEKKLDLTLSVSTDGYYIHAGGEYMPNPVTNAMQGPTLPLVETLVYESRDPETGQEAELFRIMEYEGVTYIDGIQPVSQEALLQKIKGLEDRLGSALLSRQTQDLNYPGLNNVLAKLKNRHPHEKRINLNPQQGIPFQNLVRTMDAARRKIGGSTSPVHAGMMPSSGSRDDSLFPDIRFGRPHTPGTKQEVQP